MYRKEILLEIQEEFYSEEGFDSKIANVIIKEREEDEKKVSDEDNYMYGEIASYMYEYY